MNYHCWGLRATAINSNPDAIKLIFRGKNIKPKCLLFDPTAFGLNDLKNELIEVFQKINLTNLLSSDLKLHNRCYHNV